MSERLTPEQRREVARLYVDEKLSTTTLGPMFGISQAHVSAILKGEGVAARPVGQPPKYNPDAVKECEGCGNRFTRKRMGDGSLEKPSKFMRRITCSKQCRYNVAGSKNGARFDQIPWAVGRRTLIAKTCPACGELLPAARFQRQKRGYYATDCARCVQQSWIKSLTPEQRAVVVSERNAHTKQRNDASRPQARRHRQLWTGPELELLDRQELSAPVIARMIGRTPAAVRAQRALLSAGDPRKTFLAGTTNSTIGPEER